MKYNKKTKQQRRKVCIFVGRSVNYIANRVFNYFGIYSDFDKEKT